ncbi:hypothetical protein XU18_4902 [Perkinsela sp. CCAP 1560/4]|nr:hypothetical protein XU18_4902 [Perkinsela sp. CCAP 1560/4]|eukprot:KNH03826.1 hypothetical protein XU18_4902 [Perkinsela sp. CCAP 1560/4]
MYSIMKQCVFELSYKSMLGPLCKKLDAKDFASSWEKELPNQVQVWLYWLEKHTEEKTKVGGDGEWNRMMMEIDAHTHTVPLGRIYPDSSSEDI